MLYLYQTVLTGLFGLFVDYFSGGASIRSKTRKEGFLK